MAVVLGEEKQIRLDIPLEDGSGPPGRLPNQCGSGNPDWLV